MTTLALISLIEALLPGAMMLIGDIKAIFAKHPGLTADQFAALVKATVTISDATYAQVQAEIAADQAAHPGPATVVITP